MSGPKSEARAARRSGKISARQQKKLRKVDHRLVAPHFYGLDMQPDVYRDMRDADPAAMVRLLSGHKP